MFARTHAENMRRSQTEPEWAKIVPTIAHEIMIPFADPPPLNGDALLAHSHLSHVRYAQICKRAEMAIEQRMKLKRYRREHTRA